MKVLSDEEFAEKVEKFEEFLATFKYFPKNINKILLYRYLKTCKFNYETAKNLLESNLRFRQKYPQLFLNRDIYSQETQAIINTVQFAQIQTFTKDNLHATILRLCDTDASKFCFLEVFKWMFITFDAGLTTRFIPDGEIAIVDCKGFNLWHLFKAIGNMSLVNASLKYAQDAVPAYVVTNHYINCSPIFVNFLNLIRPFVRKDYLENMHVHTSDYTTLYEFVPKALLPTEYGGTNGSFTEMNKKDVEFYSSLNDYIKDDSNWKLLD